MSPQPGLLGPQFDGPWTGRQFQLLALGYSRLEAEIEAERAKRVARDQHDDTQPLFPSGEAQR
jgi:hypothetical protein